jgi:diguanylate cyclase (GGDEF)-like protein/PAS domain S-box-containing protein
MQGGNDTTRAKSVLQSSRPLSDSPASLSEYGTNAYTRLQQELIAVRARLDRQVSRLIRLNQLSNRLIGIDDAVTVLEAYAEAILDVLDLGIGAVWELGDDQNEDSRFVFSGAARPGQAWRLGGQQLAAEILRDGRNRAVRLDAAHLAWLPGVDLVDAIACPCISRDGHCNGLLLAANTPALAGISEPISDDTFEVLTLLAEKFAAQRDHAVDEEIISLQFDRLQRSEQRLQLVLQGTNDGWWDWDLQSDACFLSLRWLEMMGCEATLADEDGKFWRERIHFSDRLVFDRILDRALSGESESVECEIRLRRDDDHYLPVLVRGTISRDARGRALRFAGSILDLTERKRHEAHVHRLAFYDSLTALPNRLLLLDRMQQALLGSVRNGTVIAVLMIDLDRFKTLNDTNGHAAGDQLLCAVGKRLRGCVRRNDTVARLGGDEFVVLLEELGRDPGAAVASAEAIAAKILRTLHEPFNLEVGVTHHSASIGLAVFNDHTLSVEMLLQRADVALYAAKAAGRNTVRLFHPEMQQRVDRRSALEMRLRKGFECNELGHVFQAQVDADGQLCGAEALMRWTPVGKSAVPPSEFIPVAEESGLIHALGEWFLEQVCDQIVLWEPHLPPDFRVSINLSEAEFLHPDFPDRVLDMLRRKAVSGRRLRLEITEESVLTEMDFAAQRMHLLRAHDIEFSLDDFGTGYSSLTYLRHLPVSEVKIDRSYVRRFPADHNDAAIVRAILSLAGSLQLRVVAEGVETDDQLRCLVQAGCRNFQGYLFGRPMKAPQHPSKLLQARPVLPRPGAPRSL